MGSVVLTERSGCSELWGWQWWMLGGVMEENARLLEFVVDVVW